MKPLILALLLLFLPQQSGLGIHARYDRFKDETTYDITESLMPDGPGYVLLSFFTVYKGEHPQIVRPVRVTMLLESHTDGWYFLKSDNTIRVIQDGGRYDLGRMEIVESEVLTHGVLEYLAVPIPFSSLEKLSAGKKIEMRIGRYEVELKPEAIQNIKAWVESFK